MKQNIPRKTKDDPRPAAKRAAVPARAAARKPASRAWFDVDRLLGASGVAAALCSASFAGYMVSNGNHAPYIFGRQYLGLFSSPSTFARTASTLPLANRVEASGSQPDEPSSADPSAASATRQFDPTPTGSIPTSASAPARADVTPPYTLVAVTQNRAWFSVGSGFEEVQPGDFVPHVGQIASTEFADGQWVVVLKDGAVLHPKDIGAPLPLASSPMLDR
jgi:hypothetical protein